MSKNLNNSQILVPPAVLVGPNGEPLAQHPFAANPHLWFQNHGDDWNKCFRKKESSIAQASSPRIVLGCMDGRPKELADLRFPGLGVLEKKPDVAVRKIADLHMGHYRDCRLVLQTHFDCLAMARFLGEKGADKNYTNARADEWGKEMMERVIALTENGNIEHEHVSEDEMNPPQHIGVVYIDCTDRFTPTDKVPYGPAISLMDPGGIRFMTKLLIRNAVSFGNGLSHHLGGPAELMLEVVCDGRNSSKKFSSQRPLTVVLILDKNKIILNNTAQRLVEKLAGEFGPHVKVLPVDENGDIKNLFRKSPRIVGFP